LHAFAAAGVVEACGVFIVLLVKWKIGIKAQVFLELIETFLRLRAGE